MKKQILSLVLLAAVISSFNTALASDVPDNLMLKQGEDFKVVGPWDECSIDELVAGCYKEYYPMTSIMQSFPIAKDQKVVINVQDRGCEGQVYLSNSRRQEIPLFGEHEVREGGQYMLINKSGMTCHVKLQLFSL